MRDTPAPIADPEAFLTDRAALSRRGFLRGAAVTGAGLAAVGIAACAPATGAAWTFGPALSPAPAASGGQPPPSAAASAPAASAAPSMDHGSPAPSGSPGASPPADHDAAALAVVERFLGGEGSTLEGAGNQPLEPTLDGDVKVFDLTIDEIEHQIDASQRARRRPGLQRHLARTPARRSPRATVSGRPSPTAWPSRPASISTGKRLPNAMDGVPHVTQEPIPPGGTFTYEFVARTTGSHMYHSHHNATDQVGRGLLGAFIVEPKDPAQRYDRLYGATQDIIWISNDALGGFTINGRGFPATAPIVATLGETIVIRFMNEGNMMHPWHLHGMPMRVVARDGYPLGSAAFTCDTLGVNPGERWDVVIECDEPGAWAFHCHILQHAEGQDGMFGMVTALVVQDAATAATAAMAGTAAGTPAFVCPVPGRV